MRLISSADNAAYKDLKRLASSGTTARKQGRVLLEGVHLVRSCLDASIPIRQLILTQQSECDDEIRALSSRLSTVSVVFLTPQLFRQLVDMPNPVGVAAVIDLPDTQTSDHCIVDSDTLAFDGIQDAGNVGAMLRAAAAAGVRTAVLGKGTARAWSPKVLRAGQGAHFAVRILEDVDLALWLPSQRLQILGTDARACKSIYDLDLKSGCIWVFGNEGQGLSASVRMTLTQTVGIPMVGGFESLNVASAAAVCLFETVRQRRV